MQKKYQNPQQQFQQQNSFYDQNVLTGKKREQRMDLPT
jgi:hypothetical protein